ncbi:MAG: hypothetical protein Q9167_006304 [Letrouitia subvulpina]
MVVEREPPKVPTSPQKPAFTAVNQPEFGKASPLPSRFPPNSIFNLPKAYRPEHHRDPPSAYSSNPGTSADPFRPQAPITSRPPQVEPDVVEIPRPANPPAWERKPAPPAVFGTIKQAPILLGFPQYPNGYYVDLTTSQPNPQGSFNSETALLDDNFGAADPYTYIDAGKATENIKALLEGAFEDDEDKPRTKVKGRKKKAEAAVAGLANKLNGVSIKEGVQETTGYDSQENEDEDEDDGTVEGLKVKLLPHQVDGVDWMKDKEVGAKKIKGTLPKGGILADDMGLGKTIQSISLMLLNPRPPKTSSSETNKKTLSNTVDKGTLVVAPLALIKQWEAEIKSKVLDSHQLRVYIHHGPQRTKRYSDLQKYDVVITTYQILVSEHGSSSERDDGPKTGCFGVHWYRIILDEAHSIKNRNAKATQACYALRAEYRWCLTGTPMQNNLDELQSLIRFLRIKPYNELSIWRDQITRPMTQGRGGLAMRRLQYYLKAFMKRRKKDVLKEDGALNAGNKPDTKGSNSNGFKITERRVKSVEAEFSPEEQSFYQRLEQRTDKSIEQMMEDAKLNYASALVLLLRLRQACNHPKLVGESMAKDRDALTTGQGTGSQSPKKSKVVEKDVDDLADMLGEITVETKKCDVCQIELSRKEAASGLIRCTECEENLQSQEQNCKKDKKIRKHQRQVASSKDRQERQKSRAARNRRVVRESEDDEGDGEWIVSGRERDSIHLGRAGGTDDEDAESGGESLASDDSLTEDESVQIVSMSSRKKVISLNTSDEEVDNEEVNSSNTEEDEEGDDEDVESDSSDANSALGAASQVAALVSSTKITRLLQLLHDESAQHKFIVFSQFTSMLNLIEPFLIRDNLTFTRYDGSMRNDQREASLERLRNDKKTRILLCSLKCGSLGLNLTAASRVVILEPFWNPYKTIKNTNPRVIMKFVEEQAIDRVHRLNQTVDVTIYKLTIANTVEARILELQEKKRALAAQAIEGGAKAAVGKLSMQEMLALFRHDAEHGHPRIYEPGEQDVGVGKFRVLPSPPPSSGGNTAGVGGGANAASKTERQGTRATPPVMEKEKGKGERRDEGPYGRRW